MKNKKKTRIYNEAYDITFWRKNSEGFMEKHEEIILVPILNGMHEKCNHDKARVIFREKYPDIKQKDIISIGYQ